nr:hypothetical protein [Tanacetum cinerariifolium]
MNYLQQKNASKIRSKSTTSGKEIGNPRKNSCGEERWRPLLVNGRSHSHHGNSKKLDISKTSSREAFETNKGHTTDEYMHLKRQIEEMLKAGKLSHLIKELKESNGKDQTKATKKGETLGKEIPLVILMVQPWKRVAKQRITQNFSSESVISFPPLGEEDGTEGPMIIEAEMGGHFVHCIGQKPDGPRLLATTPLVKFRGEMILPLGQLSLLVKIGDEEHSTSTWMNFMIVRSPSPYNRIKGRPGLRRIHAVPSTAQGMLKFSVRGRTVTLRGSRIISLECTMVSGPGAPQPVINQVTEEKIQDVHPLDKKKGQALERNKAIFEEVENLVDAGIMKAVHYHRKPANMTRVSRHIEEHSIIIREGCPPVRQKKRGQAPERNKAIYEEVKKLVDAGIMKEVHYQSWLSNPVMVKSTTVVGDMQRLNGKLASLNRFLSKSTKKSLSFFKTLKKCTKKSDFQWTAKAEMAFKQIKALIAELPMLTAPKEKEELVIYLAAAKEALSAVLMTERSGKQMPIYFVSHALQGPEINYTPIEKLIFALILADFIVERPKDDLSDKPIKDKEELTDSWILFTDGSSCIDALIADLRIAEQMGVKNLQANVDPKRVSNQVNRTYRAKEPGVIKYSEKVKNLDNTFKEFSIKQVIVKELKEKLIDEKEVLAIVEEEGHTWMTLIYEYLTEEIHPEEKRKARDIRRKAGRYAVTNGILYKRSFLGPWLRCVGLLQENYVLREIHERSCSMHAGSRSGYYWPTMHADAKKLIRECNSCQRIDIARPFPKGPSKVKFLMVAIDYFTKWIEAKPVATITGAQKRANMSLGEGIKAWLDEKSKNWMEEISHVLWAHRTMIKSSNGETPFSLTYGTEAVIPVEIDMLILKTAKVDMIKNDEALEINLDLLEEKREQDKQKNQPRKKWSFQCLSESRGLV